MLALIRSRVTRRSELPDDGGFVLLESIISISLIVIVMAGLTNFFVSVTQLSGQLRTRQSAVMYADSIADRIRGYQPTDLYLGRTSTAVKAEFKTCTVAPTVAAPCAPAQVASLLPQMTQVSDDSGDLAKLPMAIPSPTPVNGATFTAFTYIGSCYQPISNSYSDCDVTIPKDPKTKLAVPVANMLRVVIAVTWPNGKCVLNSCTYVSSTLISSDSDPTFLANQTPPNAPQISTVSNQTSAINDAVSLQMTLTSSAVVAPVTWTSFVSGVDTLPKGLSIDNTGLITGTPAGPVVTAQAVTITATDAFGRSDTENFTWKILPDLVITGFNPAAGVSTQVGLATAMTLAGSGGSGSGYSISVPLVGAGTMPPGMSFNVLNNKISGNATTAGTYTTTFNISDGTGRKRTYSYTWTIFDKPTISVASSTLAVMVGWTASQKVNYTCPTGSCTLTVTGNGTAANGMATTVLAASPGGAKVTTTTSGVTTVAVTNTSGTLYLTGIPTTPTPTVSTATTTATFSVAIADSYAQTIAPASTTWTLYTAATNTLSNASVAAGSGTISFTSPQTSITSAVCANTNCVVSLTGTSTSTPTTTLAGTWLSTATTNGSNNVNAPTATLTYTSSSGNPFSFYVRGNVTTTGLVKTTTYNMLMTIIDGSGNTLTEPATWTIS